MVSGNSFIAQLIGIGTFEPQASRIVNTFQRTKADVSELIDLSMGGQQCVVSYWPAAVSPASALVSVSQCSSRRHFPLRHCRLF